MKIGIITFHNAHNYGAVLQCWSLQQYLKKQRHEVEVINLRLPVIEKIYRLTYKSKKEICSLDFVNKMANTAIYQLRCMYACFKNPGKREKYSKFEHFINHQVPVTRRFDSYEELVAADLHYDALIAGSDQIWNAVMMKSISPAYFLQFGNADALRISYAASIGTEKIPAEYEMLFDRYLRDFDVISVREKKAREQVIKHTDKPVAVVSDPTFLLKKEDFESISRKPKIRGKYIYVHNVHLKRVDEALNSVAEELSQRLGLPVVHNWKKKIYSNEKGYFTGGIEEFLGVVSEAEYVVTNSFHCTVFAIIFHKRFITVPHFQHPDRMRNLLEELGIPDHLISNGKKIPADLSVLDIDYAAVDSKKEKMGADARQFLDVALSSSKQKDDRSYFDYKDKFRCYGCGACADNCPEHAIQMVMDHEGFRYPVVDEKLCSHCDKCKEVCIYHRETVRNQIGVEPPLVYAAYNKDSAIVDASTSGGVFTSMYRSILQKDGSVAGVCYDANMNVMYDIGDTEETCERFRGAKYVYADGRNIYTRVKELLEQKKDVLFTGTPCQIAGLKSFLGRDYPSLVTVENICSGAVSPKIFRKYCDFLEDCYKSKIVKFEFRNKFKGVNTPFVLAEFESGSIDVESAKKNNLSSAIATNCVQRPICYNCEFAELKYGVADITVGDYKGIETQYKEFANDRGVSLLKINTPKGREFFEEWKEELELQQSTYEQAYAGNYTGRMSMTGARTRLMMNIDEKPIDDLLLTFNRFKRGGIKGI